MSRLNETRYAAYASNRMCWAFQDMCTRAVINQAIGAYKAYRQITPYSPCIKISGRMVQQNNHWMTRVPTL
jgi:hypothetical protein